ncbi:putative membrane protein [Rhodovulum sulfidophilum]|uniref:Putative membrane protein n=1 Tax=Rhodovulum sulfidophilum TaxID=35806 RepID=A0A0D6AZB5_RHOSU|nr:putative membrane protein [Rhodovulum sulfidophilum]
MPIKDILLDWRLHGSVLVITVIAELIGVIVVPIGIGSILLLPLLYAFVMGLLINPNVIAGARALIRDSEVHAASPLIVIAIMPFIAKFGTIIGPSMETIIAAGPALVLQELGNLGTIVLAFPVAVLVLRMGRESIGACFSVAREPNIAIIADKYGLKSQEGTGVMGVYVIGTLFGTFIFAILASILATTGAFSIEALAMACGIGSGSMMAACSGALVHAVPDMEEQILALAGASNVLTYATGLYLCVFVALPLTEKLYDLLGRKDPSKAGA